MSASLVGSEMCIRDRAKGRGQRREAGPGERAALTVALSFASRPCTLATARLNPADCGPRLHLAALCAGYSQPAGC
eukprot:8267116-Alexandrium_andersonii.AAC.1